MRIHAFHAAVLTAAVLAATFPVFLSPATGQDETMDRLYVTIYATSDFRFVRDLIVIQRAPTLVNVTVVNDHPQTDHTFTIRSAADRLDYIVDTGEFGFGETRQVEFVVWSTTVEAGGRNITAEALGGGVRFFCKPHETLQMVGRIVIGDLAPTPTEPPEKGVFLRAYWIGVLGMAATLLLTGISYFVIKSSSRHFRDHHEHIRRGGP